MVVFEYQHPNLPDTSYRVLFQTSGVRCSCPAFQNSRSPDPCPHIADAERRITTDDRRFIESDTNHVLTPKPIVLAKTLVRGFTFNSNSTPGKTYETKLWSDGTASCNCPGWTQRIAENGMRSCRHTNEVIQIHATEANAARMERIARTNIRRGYDVGRNSSSALSVNLRVSGTILHVGDLVVHSSGGRIRKRESGESAIGVVTEIDNTNRQAVIQLISASPLAGVRPEDIRAIAQGLPTPPATAEQIIRNATVSRPDPQPKGTYNSVYFPNPTDRINNLEVRIYESGNLTCSCPTWKTSGAHFSNRSCDHTREVEKTAKKMSALVQPKFTAPKPTAESVRHIELED